MGAHIPTYHQRLADPMNLRSPFQCIEDEVRELRTALEQLQYKPVAQVIRDADGCDDVRWLVDSASGYVQPGDLLYKSNHSRSG